MNRLNMCDNLKVICISVNGEVMLHFSASCYYSSILLYNSKDDTFEDLLELEFCEDLIYRYESAVYTYVESLVSP